MDGPRLKLRAYITAPDRGGLKGRLPRSKRVNSPYNGGGPSRKKLADAPQFTVVAGLLIPAHRASGSTVCERVVEHSHHAERRPPLVLSGRETECLLWVSRGKSSADIGQIVGLSPRTVDSYLEKACAKLGVRTRIEAVAVGVRSGLIDPEED
ncbi:helix-turn-helix transcriptional regulator [Brevundimonas kwangchunensis]